ncbi:MAG: DUF1351 domain-containing protein [Sphaerochaetaceae bacterium]|nr:DUF1351 domain-containing protein [Sphaerochaetaceae bacterium]
MSEQLIAIKQLPIIEERLQSISEAIQTQTAEALSLTVTEGTVKEIKKRRTELTKNFKMLEDQRKAVKSAVMAPYEAFEEVYKKYVTDIFKPADSKLKSRIDEVETSLLSSKRSDVAAYFQEAASERNIDFIEFDQLGIKVLFSDSMKKLKEQVEDALNKITGELAVIGTLDFPEEILVEYKDNLNLTSSVLTVKTRRERLAAELQRKAEMQQTTPVIERPAIQEPVASVAKEPEPEEIPEVVTAPTPEAEPEKSLITITVKCPSYNELMAITEVCKARRLAYTIS